MKYISFDNHTKLKPDRMPALQLKQLQFEADTGKRLLAFMMDENVRMKNRISEILKADFDKNLLDELENFHSRFIKEDELISLMRNDAAEMDKLLLREIFKDGKVIREVKIKLKKMRDNLLDAERKFGKLKAEFNGYLSENI
ncbi:MAG TPA: hypothetical protein PLP23_19615 [Panacibacter sp.]|nr:hypothetical protein [Panacibacter sp.]